MNSTHLCKVALFFMGVLIPEALTQTPLPPTTPIPADVDGNGFVDEKDLLYFHRDWHKGARFEEDAVVLGLPGLSQSVRPLKMRRIHSTGKTFQMGSPDTERGRETNEGPVHAVTFDYDFYISETEITQAQWVSLMVDNPAAQGGYSTYGFGDDYPIFNVSWSDCQAFAAALTSLGRGTFRLPTEAEWEYACRAGSTTRFYFGNSLFCADECENCDTAKGTIFIERRLDFMWFCAGQNSAVHRPVATLFPNLFGLYDMHGNVSEWCLDSYHENYEGAPTDGSAWVSFESTRKAIRGGDSVDSADECRSASRSGASTNPFIGDRYIGLRVVRVQ